MMQMLGTAGRERRPNKSQALALLRDRGVPIATVLDVGVQRATPELIAAFPEHMHLLFEPVAEYAADIEQAYAATPHLLVGAAVADREGSIGLKTRSIVSGQEITHSTIAADSTVADRQVPIISLDGFLAANPYPGPYLLKIDIDGEELKVLAGAQATLAQCSVVIIELYLREFLPRIVAVQDAGFELFDLSEPSYYDDAFWQCDGIFVRKDIHRALFRDIDKDFDPERYVSFVS
jgi:FkbM family methyltransferase